MKRVSFLLVQTGRPLLPDAPRTKPKKELKLLLSAASLTSCQTIPVKALFLWRPEEESFGECKGKCTQGGRHVELIGLLFAVGEDCKESTRWGRAGMIGMDACGLIGIYLGL